MIKVRKDGSAYYYYYKKKVGRHKKTGKKPTLLSDGSNSSYVSQYKYTRNFSRLSEFAQTEPIKYAYCKEKGWLFKLFPYGCRYTKEECRKLCSVYENSEELLFSDEELYDYLVSRKWLNKIFSCVQEQYCKSKCILESQKYRTFKEFRDGSPRFYTHCLHKGYLLDFTWLEDDRISMYTDPIDCVYAYEFEDKKAIYIGRTLIIRAGTRDWEHVYNSDVLKWLGINIVLPTMKILESGLTLQQGLEREDYYVNYYRDLGYTVLNKARTGIGSGSVGSLNSGKWNKKTCYEEALKYKRRSDMNRYCPGAYRVARRNKWLDDYTWFNEKPKMYYWTYDKCKLLASECSNRLEFNKKHQGAYNASYRNGWLDEFFENKTNNNGYTYMKSKCIYKIDYSTMSIVDEFKKISDITSDKNIYRVLRGEKVVYDDGYMYRKDCDIEIDQNTGKVVDKLCAKTKDEKMYIKYDYVINLLKNTTLSLSEICRESNLHGCKISEPTCRMLKEKYCGNLD